ncbi:MAG: hypothetical protein R3B07_11595 [Polyangiaceae bacterium]
MQVSGARNTSSVLDQLESAPRGRMGACMGVLADRVEVLPFITVNYVPFDGEYLP